VTDPGFLELTDRLQDWYRDLLANHGAEAAAKAASILDGTTTDANGCMITPTATPAKVRFMGEQDRAYRFVYCVTAGVALSSREVVRHSCNNRRCVNPDHLVPGDHRDNLDDHRGFLARGVDYDLL
jgi:hypothetical protein